MLSIYYIQNKFKDEDEVREIIDQLTINQLSSINGLSIDFLRQFKDRIDFEVIFFAPYNDYFLDRKIKAEFLEIAEEQFNKIINK